MWRYWIASTLVLLSGLFVAYDCAAGRGGPGGGAGGEGVEWRTVKRISHGEWHGDGQYGTDFTIIGHTAWSDGLKATFSVNSVDVKLGEMCTPPDNDWQWDYNRQRNYALIGSPYTTEISGGYHTREIWELWTCSIGQALYWELAWYWSDASPEEVEDGGADLECVRLSGFGGEPPPELNFCG